MKSSVLFVLLSFVGAVSLSARGTGSGPVPNINQTGQLEEAGFSGFLSAEPGLIIPIPDCGPCEPGDDPWTEDEIPLPPMPKPPGLPKCYPVCVAETVAASAPSSTEPSLIIPIPDCGPCEPGDDPWTEDEIPLPPMPKPPGLPKCYPVCVTEGVDSPQFQALGLMSWSARLPFAARPEARVALTRVRAAA
jgi:hypothetical protein